MSLGGGGSDMSLGGAGEDLAVAADLATGADLATSADFAMQNGGADMASPPDLALTGDAPVLLSPVTRPTMACPLVATSTSGTLFMWTQATADRTDTDGISSLTNWAFTASDGTVTHGEHFVPGWGGSTCGATLWPFGSSFLFSSPQIEGTYVFNGTSLVKVTALGGVPPPLAVSGSYAMTIGGYGATPTAYDVNGTQVSSTALSNVAGYAGTMAIGGDGSGGFAVAYQTVSGAINFVAYSGGTWSAAETVAGPIATQVDGMQVAYGAGTWAVSWTPSRTATTVSVAVRASGPTWTATSFNVVNPLHSLAGNATTILLATFYYSASTGYQVNANVYAGGAWTTTTVDTHYMYLSFGIVSTGSGYVMDWSTNPGVTTAVSIFNGTSWTTPISVGGSPSIAVGNGAIAVGSTTTSTPAQAVIYANGAWGTSSAVSSAASPTGMSVAPTATGFVAAYVDNPATVTTRAWTPSTWSATTSSLPANLQTGAATETSLADGNNGHALVFFAQYDLGNPTLFAAEFDGTQWGTAVAIATGGGYPNVVAFAGGFELSWTDGTNGYAAKWAGASTTPIQLFKSYRAVPLAWNGTTLMAASANGATQVATSADGVTWSTPSTVDAYNFDAKELVGNGSGFALQTDYVGGIGGNSAHILVWQAGTWSAPVTMNDANGCALAAASATFLAVCAGTTLDAQFWQNGAFTDVPVSTTSAAGFVLASDGANYRLEYGGNEALFANGAWSSPTAEANVAGKPIVAVVALGDSWRLLTVSRWQAARASVVGGGPFGMATPIEQLTGAVDAASLAAGPTRVDAAWTKPSVGTFMVPAVYARTGI
jgi:hypothetical protein